MGPLPRRRRMRTFKEFIMTLPEEVLPDEAKAAYKQYQADFWGSEVRADFELNKNEEWCAPGVGRVHAPAQEPGPCTRTCFAWLG